MFDRQLPQAGITGNHSDANGADLRLGAPTRFSIENKNVKDKEQRPDAASLARAERRQPQTNGRDVQTEAAQTPFTRTRFQINQPPSAGEKERQAVGATGNVIDRST